MVFQEPDATVAANLTTRNALYYSRPMNDCHGFGGNTFFISSECTPEAGRPRSMQAYRVVCHRVFEEVDFFTGEYDGAFTQVPVFKHGHCRDDEICVSGLGAEKAASGHRIASCVKLEFFIHMAKNVLDGANKTKLKTSLEGRTASMMISKPDGNTAIEVDTFAVNPIIATDYVNDPDAEGLTAVHSRQAKCRDCVELETQQFEKGTEGLRAQATLLTTGAAAGIMWLALLSG